MFFKFWSGATGIPGGGGGSGIAKDRIIKLRRQRAFMRW